MTDKLPTCRVETLIVEMKHAIQHGASSFVYDNLMGRAINMLRQQRRENDARIAEIARLEELARYARIHYTLGDR